MFAVLPPAWRRRLGRSGRSHGPARLRADFSSKGAQIKEERPHGRSSKTDQRNAGLEDNFQRQLAQPRITVRSGKSAEAGAVEVDDARRREILIVQDVEELGPE